ncbi:MAG: hypothetical protein HYZ47_00780 [Simkania negevensis]|nr:hypothetical protein [Simkania negevensis]
MAASIGTMLRTGVRASFSSGGSQAQLLSKNLPEVMKRWHSSDSQKLGMVGPAPSQLPMPGEEGHEHFFKNLERFNKSQYPMFSLKKVEELGNKEEILPLQKLFTEVLNEMKKIRAQNQEIYAQNQRIELRLSSVSKVESGK